MIYTSFVPDSGKGASGVGDFAVWGKFILGDGRGDLKYGVRFGAKLPNTPSHKHFGTNQTDFCARVYGCSHRGLGILGLWGDRHRGQTAG